MASAAPAAGGTASLADSNMASYYTKDVSIFETVGQYLLLRSKPPNQQQRFNVWSHTQRAHFFQTGEPCTQDGAGQG